MLKVRDLSIEPRSSTICIDLVTSQYIINLYNQLCTMQELGSEAK